MPRTPTRALLAGLSGVTVPVLVLLAVGLTAAEDRTRYDLIRDLFVPLVGPLVAVLVPTILLYVIPYGQDRHKTALRLCEQFLGEELRESRNVAWRYFVTEQQELPAGRRAERLAHFRDYLRRQQVHLTISPELDTVYQKMNRVLDFFALVNGCVQRGTADPELVRESLMFYYVHWRDGIMEPLRQGGDFGAARPAWWPPLAALDRLAAT
jgi:hypothetical protein